MRLDESPPREHGAVAEFKALKLYYMVLDLSESKREVERMIEDEQGIPRSTLKKWVRQYERCGKRWLPTERRRLPKTSEQRQR